MRLDISRCQVCIMPYIVGELEDTCNFWYTFGSQAYIAHYVLGGLKNICNSLVLRYTLRLMFLVD